MAQTPEPSRPALVLRIFNDDIDKPTLAELAIAQIKAHVNFFHTQEAALSAKRSAAQSTGASSLSDLAAHKIVDALCADDTTESLQILLSNCPATLLAKVLEGTALPYPAFRKLATVCRDDALAEKINGSLHGRDVDEWVLRNERVMRGILGKDQERMMVDLERDAGTIWPDSEVDGEVRVLTRKEPPKETLAVLGQRRKRNLRVLATTDAFKKRFDRLTGGALDGLDWNNCFVAGGMALATLMCTYDYLEKNSKNSDIDMYIYGLSPQEANEKIREIYDVWWKNLGPTKKTFCIKNSKTITFMSNYPEKRIQVCCIHIL